MNAFQPIPRDVLGDQIHRETLLAQPPEFFRHYRHEIPNLIERAYLVETLIQAMAAPSVYANDVYCVRIRNSTPCIQLDISRHDRQPCSNWHEFQRIKNELIGPGYDAVQLFPAESRLVDTANQYHLWVMGAAG